MFKWFSRYAQRLDQVMGALAWLEARDSVVETKNGQVFVRIYEKIPNGPRIRLCEGVGCCLLSAIDNAAGIIRVQESSGSLSAAASKS